jgi:histidinol-phosphatase (PHP family)
MKYDYHLHTEDSYDSSLKAESLVRKAIELNYDEIAITEHLDLLPQELRIFGLPSLMRYQKRIKALQSSHPQIKILFGIEIGDYHQVQAFARELVMGLDFDITLGSVHFLSDHTNIALPLAKPLSAKQVNDYYQQNLSLVSSCQIDVLAHLGVYKRHYPSIPDESFAYPIIKDIFSVMIERNIALEINLSSLRNGYPSFLPEPHIIELYLHQGGTLFSIGSDAHYLEHFDLFRDSIPTQYQTPFRHPN